LHLSFTLFALILVALKLGQVAAQDLLNTQTALATTLVLLNQADRSHDVHVEVAHWVLKDLFDRLGTLVVGPGQVSVHDLVDEELLFEGGLGFLFWLLFRCLFLLFCLAGLLLLFSADDGLLECELDLDAVVFFEVAGHGDLDDGGVVLQVEKQLVEVDVDALGSVVENHHVLFHLANADDRGLEDFLDELALLGVHDLVVTLFELAINVDVLDVQARVVLEDFVVGPGFDVL